MRITVNGKLHKIEKTNLSYEDVCVLAMGKVVQYLTVVYHKGGDPAKRNGILTPNGPDMIAQEGTIVSAVFTGYA